MYDSTTFDLTFCDYVVQVKTYLYHGTTAVVAETLTADPHHSQRHERLMHATEKL